MSSPSYSVNNATLKVDIPSGWYFTTSSISQVSYSHIITVAHSLFPKSMHIFRSQSDRKDGTMTNLRTGTTSFFFAGQNQPSTITIDAYYSNVHVPPKALVDPKYKGSGLQVTRFSRSLRQSKAVPDYEIFIVPVAHTPESDRAARYNDAVVTIYCAKALELSPLNNPVINVECACCFKAYPPDQMIQCPEEHLFCLTCIISYINGHLNIRSPHVKCMDQSGCTAEIPSSAFRHLLPDPTLDLWERVNHRHRLESAGFTQFEECPFCGWACAIVDDNVRPLQCNNSDACEILSCRWCKKTDHSPQLCKVEEVEAKHVIDEAMSNALIRRCPACKYGFIKEHGCNKVHCPSCRACLCYVCCQLIPGYPHFSHCGCDLRAMLDDKRVRDAGDRATRDYMEAKRPQISTNQE